MPIDLTQFDRDYQAVEADWSDYVEWAGVQIPAQIDRWERADENGAGGFRPEYRMTAHVRAGAWSGTVPNVGNEVRANGKRLMILSIETSEDGHEHILELGAGE